MVFEFKDFDYFGELALIREERRAANVIAKSDCHVCLIDRDAFNRLLGPLADLLKRNTIKYDKYVKNIK